MQRELELWPWDSEYDDDNDRYIARFRDPEHGVTLEIPEDDCNNSKPMHILITQEDD